MSQQDGYGVRKVSTGSGPGSGPAGSDTQIQYNDNDSFGASADLIFNGATFRAGNQTDTTLIVGIAATGRIIARTPGADFLAGADIGGNGTFFQVDDSTSSITLSGGQIVRTRVVTAAGDVTVTAADYIVIVNKDSGAATAVNLPAGVLNTVFVIKDGKGDAGSNNITITPDAGNIDGAGTAVINNNYGVRTLVYNGTQWNVI